MSKKKTVLANDTLVKFTDYDREESQDVERIGLVAYFLPQDDNAEDHQLNEYDNYVILIDGNQTRVVPTHRVKEVSAEDLAKPQPTSKTYASLDYTVFLTNKGARIECQDINAADALKLANDLQEYFG